MNLLTIEDRLAAEHNLPGDFVFFRWKCFPKATETLYVELRGGRCPLLTRGPREVISYRCRQ